MTDMNHEISELIRYLSTEYPNSLKCIKELQADRARLEYWSRFPHRIHKILDDVWRVAGLDGDFKSCREAIDEAMKEDG